MEMTQTDKVYVEKKHDYASKGTGNAALSLGIIGTALGAFALSKLGGGGLNLFGGPAGAAGCGNSCGCGAAAPTAFQAWSKECDDAVALTSAIYQGRIVAMNERFQDRQVINTEMFGLYKSQIDADFGLYKNGRDQFDALSAEIGCLKTQIAVQAATRPYQDKLIMCEIADARKDAEFNLFRRTCRMISGEVVLPSTPLVTGFGSFNSPGCGCGGGHLAAAV